VESGDSGDEAEAGPLPATIAVPATTVRPSSSLLGLEPVMEIALKSQDRDRPVPASLDPGGREEWMLTPGERKPFGG
jgi:hypothetical protein